MERGEKTVFICYRRTNVSWALAIYQYLNHRGYDVFFDTLSIAASEFERVIFENIKERAHLVVFLTPLELARCKEPGDWYHRGIETALETQQNIVPLMLEGFDFGVPSTTKCLTGKLEMLNKFNGLRVPEMTSGLERIRRKFWMVTSQGSETRGYCLKLFSCPRIHPQPH